MDKSARRFFLDVDDAGNIIISATSRTSFDNRGDVWQHGKSDVANPASEIDAERLASLRSVLGGFSSHIDFAGRCFFINIQSIPTEQIAT